MEKEKFKVQVVNHVRVDNHVEYLLCVIEVSSNFKIFFFPKIY